VLICDVNLNKVDSNQEKILFETVEYEGTIVKFMIHSSFLDAYSTINNMINKTIVNLY